MDVAKRSLAKLGMYGWVSI